MKSFVVVSSVLVAAGSAMALPFNAVSYEAGGGLPGIVGQGFSVSSGGFFTALGAGTNVGPGSAGAFTALNFHEFDSHFALDTFGPSARNRTASPGNNSTMTLNFYGNYGPPGGVDANYDEGEMIPGYALIVGPGSHIGDPSGGGGPSENLARAGIGVAPPPVASSFAPNVGGGRSTLDGVFVARFTIRTGATLSGGMFFNVLVGPGVADGQHLTLGGPAVVFNTHNGPQPLVLRAYLIGTVNITQPSQATADGVNDEEPFGSAQVWDLWVHLIPAPGAVALFGLGGLALARRRRA